ncbi:hypothetical protein [Nocardioides sp. SYSU DS0651]|uniref:hypothetical protein n=1 Tax=Nocardioides sp. SYSU DS0651 TaxID=3415955 RepID=UPI003F4BA756
MKRDEPDDHDEAWQAIVANYGDPVLGPDDATEPVEQPLSAGPRAADDLGRPDDSDERQALPEDPDDSFVPPRPPPVPKPPFDRRLAWLGVFGAPAILLAVVVTGIDLPQLLGWLLVGWFVGGFLYLVARMPPSPRDPWDDGAQV